MSPLVISDPSVLPPTFLYTSQYDGLSDDGMLYASLLEKHNVPVHHQHERAGYHGILFHFRDVKEAAQLYVDIRRFINNNV